MKPCELRVPSQRPLLRRKLSVAEEDELKKRLKELSDLGLIRPSKSPWAAPVLFVPKKDGTLRFCVDYRGLNKVTIRDEHALPIPEDQIRRLHGAKVFSKIDLHSGYYQIAVAGEDVTKTAFTTTFGLYEFLVMPFGLSNAPATFSRLMMEIFKDYLYDFVLVYLDDILIFSKDEEEHEKHVRLVLDRLKEHNLIAKLSKCSFFQAEVEYLGFVVSGNGVKMAEDKVRAVLEWPTPSNATEVRGFLGLTGYYRHFIKHYAHIAAPLNELTKKSLRFLWTPLHTHAFEELKKSVTSSPVLQVYDASKQCVVCTDASNVAVGAVLLQVGESTEALRPVAFFSRKLRGAELNYDARTKEFLAIKLTAYKWKHYLNNGTTPLFYTDHQSLQYLNSQTELSPKFMRWFGSITGWLGGPPDIRYKPGKQNVVADALSRRPDHCICALSLVVPADDLIQQIRDGLKLDEFALQEAEKIKAGTSDYFWDNELLYRFINGRLQLYVPKIGNLREMLISEMHDLPLVGHQGTNRTLRRLIEQFGWPGIAKDVEEYVGGCQSCLQSKPRTGFPAGLLQPLERPGEPWESISMDFIVKLPKTKEGYDAVMVVVDRFSKYVEFVPTFTTASAEDIATLFYKNILCRHGCPSSIVSDRDSKFISSFWQSLWSSVGTRLKLSTSYHPQTDGQTERINRVLEEMLRSFCVLDPASWVNFLPQAAFAYNTAVNASLKSRPFSVVYGRTPKLPASYVAEDSRAVPVSVERFRERHEHIISKVSELLNAAQARQAFYSNKKRVDVSFDVGDEVLLNSRNLSLDGSNPPKLKPLFVGPFKILKKVGPVAYTLDMPSTFKGHTTFHVSVLKRCPNTSSQFPLRAAFSEPPPLYYQRGDAFYEVEQIVAHRGPKDAREFRIKWKGYQTRTWEPEENLLNNKFYLEYLEKLPQRRGRR
ncbi:putative Transposon Tf2-9 polyprotein [Nannochloris sp. 'desiccata']|nr:putative Transposon Tf2-9 polyprotein [Chlorella desiccata (nom. nud.)]